MYMCGSVFGRKIENYRFGLQTLLLVSRFYYID